MRRHELTDEEWNRISDLMPAGGGRGKPWKDHRLMISGMLWILCTGAPWRDLPAHFGPWKTVYERFRRWSAEGLWDRILERLKRKPRQGSPIDWTLVCIDGSSIRAHRCAAGASKNSGERA